VPHIKANQRRKKTRADRAYVEEAPEKEETNSGNDEEGGGAAMDVDDDGDLGLTRGADNLVHLALFTVLQCTKGPFCDETRLIRKVKY